MGKSKAYPGLGRCSAYAANRPALGSEAERQLLRHASAFVSQHRIPWSTERDRRITDVSEQCSETENTVKACVMGAGSDLFTVHTS